MKDFDDINWLGHAGFYFLDKSGNKIYFVDPFNLPAPNLPKGDIAFITHAHYDHFSSNDIAKIVKQTTILVATADVLAKSDISSDKKFEVLPNKNYQINGFSFSTIPAYNNKSERLNFHPKTNNWVGYIFNLNGKKVYHAGDTDFIEEMKGLKNLNLDIAMLPMGGTYTMDVNEMIEAANAISAKYTVPMHYKDLLGKNYLQAEEKLKKGVINSKVLVLEEVKQLTP